MVFKDLTSEILVNVILLHKNVKEWSDKAWKDMQKEGYTESNFFHMLAEKMLCEYYGVKRKGRCGFLDPILQVFLPANLNSHKNRRTV